MGAAFLHSFRLILSGDREVYEIAFASLRFAFFSTIFVTALGVPAGTGLALSSFPGKRLVTGVITSLMAIPTVVVGLFVFAIISRSGPLGYLSLLFTPGAIIVGQTVLAFPVTTSLMIGGLGNRDPMLDETLRTFGSGRLVVFWMTLRESRNVVVGTILASFARIIGEVGVSMMLGGNIRFYTRTLTTAIALETGKGEVEQAFALGIILLILALLVNFLVHTAARRGR